MLYFHCEIFFTNDMIWWHDFLCCISSRVKVFLHRESGVRKKKFWLLYRYIVLNGNGFFLEIVTTSKLLNQCKFRNSLHEKNYARISIRPYTLISSQERVQNLWGLSFFPFWTVCFLSSSEAVGSWQWRIVDLHLIHTYNGLEPGSR